MTDHNRGAYTPQSEAPLAFDARRTRGSGDRPFPLALVISGVILAAIVIALLVFLLTRPDGSETVAEGGETIDVMKLPPPEPAAPVAVQPDGMQVVTVDPEIPETPAFAPPPEQPVMRPTAPAPQPPPAAAAADPVGALTVSKAPAPAAPPRAPAPAAAPKPAATPASASQVQIGAFSTPALAEKGWNDIAGLFPGQMAGKTKRVEAVESNGVTLHRAFIGGFSSRTEAEAFCQSLKSAGRQCLVR